MKKILLLLTAILLLVACKKKTSNDTLLIDTEHVSVEGSFVQGSLNTNLCKAVIPYANSNGGTAEIIADEVNGLKIEKQTITLNNTTGEIKVNIAGTPLLLQSTFLQVQIKYGGETYITSVEIPIASDPNPNGTVTFTIDNTPIVGLTTSTTLNFTVDPTMTAIINTTTIPVQGLTVTISTNSTTGQGTVTFTPSATFMGGTVQITAQFGARPTQVVDIPVSYFATGDGTSVATAFPVTDAVSLAKVQYGTATQYFKVMNDFDAGTWTPMATFNTNLDGNSKTISYTTNTPTADSVALIKKINGGSISNLTLTGTATGKSLVAGLATWSNVNLTALSGVTSTVVVTGTNNVANLIASGGAGKQDASVLVVTTLPTLLNILDPATSGTATLGVTPTTVDFTTSNNNTLATFTYSAGTITANMPSPASSFVAGNINYDVKLSTTGTGQYVHLAQQTMAISFSKPFESGIGTAGDPYIVIDGMGLNQTMITYPASYIKVKNDVTVTSWTTVTSFSGNLDGDGHKVSGLDKPMIATLTGTVKNIKLITVSTTAGVTGQGILTNIGGSTTIACTIQSVGINGNLTASASPAGGIVGEMVSGNVDNCYYNGAITGTFSYVGGIVGRIGNTSGISSSQFIVSNCTSTGSMATGTSSAGVGGILGRCASTSTKYVLITNCSSSMSVTGGNMVGGIFGANQYSPTTMRTANSQLKIDQCLFTGTVTASAGAAGGISGVGSWTTNCMVIGQGAGTSASPTHIYTAAIGSVASSAAGIVSGAKDAVDNCIVVNSRMTGATGATYGPAGIVSTKNGGPATLSVNSCVAINSAVLVSTGRSIIGYTTGGLGTIYTSSSTNNYYNGIIYSDGSGAYSPVGNVIIDGTATTSAPSATNKDVTQQAFWTDPTNFTTPYDFTNIWTWDAGNNRPKLQHVGCDPSVIP